MNWQRIASVGGVALWGLFTVGCGDSAVKHDPFQEVVKPDPELDPTADLVNGPYLTAPAQGTVTIGWKTDVASSSRVSYGREGEDPVEVSGYTFRQLPTTDDPLLKGIDPEGYFHEVVLEDLEPGAIYDYTVLSASGLATGTFMAPPAFGDRFSFVAYGDSRTGHDEHRNVIDSIVSYMDAHRHPAVIINTGDMTMTGGNEDEWQEFFEIENGLLSDAPILPTFGNHDFILGRTYFEGLFKAPPTSTSGSDRYYSADIGNVHITVIDLFTMQFEDHMAWVDEDLAHSVADFKVVALHWPLFTYSNHAPPYQWRDQLLDIFERNGVQLATTGHNHCYERFLGYGAIWITTGGAGAPLYDVDDNLEYDNLEATRITADRAFHFLWGDVTPQEMTVRVLAGDDTATTPAATEVDCFTLSAGEPVTEDTSCL